MSMDDTPRSAPLTRADIPELVKAVADTLSKKEPLTDPPRPVKGGHSSSEGELDTCKQFSIQR